MKRFSTPKNIFTTVLVCVSILTSYTQETTLKTLFVEAESYYLFEEYKEALPIYQKILRDEPENYNVIYKIGVCYLNDKFQKQRAINYLERAVNNTTSEYKVETFKEKLAPVEANFYLGDAYRVNNRFKEALDQYTYFLEIMDEEVYDVQLVLARIKETKYAMKSVEDPRYFESKNLGDQINSRFAEMSPVISGDGNTFAFTRKLQFYDGVFVCYKTATGWSNPVNLTPDFGLDGNVYTTGLSYDGKELFVYRSDEYNGNIYSSKKGTNGWGLLTKLNDNINTKYWESHASLSEDGNTLLFTSNRKGGYGGLDIYISKKQTDGEWGPATNLGDRVNSQYNEDAPFFAEKGAYIYFSSQGHNNMGGYDIFRSKRLSNGEYGTPQNLGYPINTSFDDLFYHPQKKGEFAYYAMFNEDGYGLDDIYYLEVFSELHPRTFTLNGELDFDARIPSDLKKSIQIKLVNKETKTVELVEYLENSSGIFDLKLNQGVYDVIISGVGIDSITYPIEALLTQKESELFLKQQVTTNDDYKDLSRKEIKELAPPVLEVVYDSLIVSAENTAVLNLKVNKNSTIFIQHTAEGIAVAEDSVFTEKSQFTYQVNLQEGLNRFDIIVRDENSKILKDFIEIRYEPETIEPLATKADSLSSTNDLFWTDKALTNSSDQLKILLSTIDRKHYNNPEALYEMLMTSANGNPELEDEIISMFASYYAKKSVDQYKNNLLFAATGNLGLAIKTIEPGEFALTEQLAKSLYNKSGDGFNDYDILSAMAYLLADNDSAKLEEFYTLLLASANGNLKREIQHTDLLESNIITPHQLLLQLYNNAEKGEYSKYDLFDLLHDLSTNIQLREMYFDMIYYSKDELQNYVARLDIEERQIHTTQSLIAHLLEQSKTQPFTSADVIKAIEESRSYRLNSEIIKSVLATNSVGILREFILETDNEEIHTLGFSAYVDKIILHADENGYQSTEVINMLVDASGVNNTKEFIGLYRDLSNASLKEYIEGLNLDDFNSPVEFINHLMEQAAFNNYTSADVIDVLKKLAFLNICQLIQKGDTPIDQPAFELSNKEVILGVTAILLLAFLTIIFARRRKRE